ncbi:MAG: UDP-3-O-(3-hydroxymyristoyl)glucosamine N-acyltransferase [bacterium]|nr:UDP-3-O-(3-hydroxymyristoyl)glucosamine N-acyltransferase [bacterium]
MPGVTAAQLAELVGGQLIGDARREIVAVAPLEGAEANCVSFLANVKYVSLLTSSGAGVVFVGKGVARSNGDVIEVNDPYAAFVTALEYFHPERRPAPGVHPHAAVAADVELGDGVTVGPGCVIESGARIGNRTVLEALVFVGARAVVGDDCYIHPNTTLRHRVELGHRVIVHAGTVIGSDGFGFAFDSGHYRKIPQVGTVVIENDVEIGANTTIDRATMGETRIGEGTKIDNLVQIAHNVRIGKHCVIVAQAGISGSTILGNYCRVGGQAGFVGHIKIGDGASFGAQSGVSQDVKAGDVLSGSPARPHSLWKRIEVSLPRLPDLLRRVKRIEERLAMTSEAKESEHGR